MGNVNRGRTGHWFSSVCFIALRFSFISFWYVDGVMPFTFLKARRKLLAELYPNEVYIACIVRLPKFLLSSIRRHTSLMRYSFSRVLKFLLYVLFMTHETYRVFEFIIFASSQHKISFIYLNFLHISHFVE